jgi:transglutaminase-like putative cysteine protease
MAMASLLAFAGGAGLEVLSATLAFAGLLLSLLWLPSPALGARLDRVWLPLALFLVARALLHIFVIRDDVVIPVVDLLFLLLIAEALRPLEAQNDARLYALSFALLLASTAYRPGLLFALAFTAFVGLATVALMVGHLRRLGEKHRVAEIPIPRAFLLTTAALSGVTLAFSALVFLAFPRVSQGWTGRGAPTATSLAGFADEVSLGSHGSRIFGNPQIVLRVEFPGGLPLDLRGLYWRGRSYDRFDGVRWSRSDRVGPSLAPPAWYAAWGRDLTEQRIYGASLDARVLFALHPTVDIEAHSEIQPVIDNVGDIHYWGSAAPAYTVQSATGRPAPAELRSAREGFIPAPRYFLQLPDVPPEVRALGDSLLGDLSTTYDKAQALVDWFQSEFRYTLDLPGSAREATLEHFLLRRRAGHCEYFSTAMAVLLRAQGIPAREVNGFLGGEWSEFGNYLAVTQNQAHAWVEVWFQGFGWVPFDPTPAGTGEGFAEAAWFWPGRFLFDALQHRWNKWVLDYSFQTQFDLLQRTRQALSSDPRTGRSPGPGTAQGLPGGPLWWFTGIFFLCASCVWAFRKDSVSPSSARTYLRLRAAGKKAGMPPEALHSPLAFTRHLERARHPAAAPSREVVDLYLQDRYSGSSIATSAVISMRRSASVARKALRKKPLA